MTIPFFPHEVKVGKKRKNASRPPKWARVFFVGCVFTDGDPFYCELSKIARGHRMIVKFFFRIRYDTNEASTKGRV
jgi:hypothetical protein